MVLDGKPAKEFLMEQNFQKIVTKIPVGSFEEKEITLDILIFTRESARALLMRGKKAHQFFKLAKGASSPVKNKEKQINFVRIQRGYGTRELKSALGLWRLWRQAKLAKEKDAHARSFKNVNAGKEMQ